MNTNIIWNGLLSAVATFIALLVLPGLEVDNYVLAGVIAVALGLLNISVRPLMQLLNIIPTLFTIILFLFAFSGTVLIAADWMTDMLRVENFGYVLLFSSTLAIANWGLHRLFRK